MLLRSPRPASSSMGAIPLETGKLSPVSDASEACNAVDSIRRASAGIVSPSSTSITSPGTRSAAGMLRRAPLPERRHRPLGPRLLDVAQSTVQEHDREDGHSLVGQSRIALVDPQPDGDRRGDEQQDDERVPELSEKTPPGGHRLLCLELVRAVALEASSRLLGAQAPPYITAEPGDNLLDRQAVLGCLFSVVGPRHHSLVLHFIIHDWSSKAICSGVEMIVGSSKMLPPKLFVCPAGPDHEPGADCPCFSCRIRS